MKKCYIRVNELGKDINVSETTVNELLKDNLIEETQRVETPKVDIIMYKIKDRKEVKDVVENNQSNSRDSGNSATDIGKLEKETKGNRGK